MPDTDEIIDLLGGLSLFADLSRPELEEVSHTFEEEWFGAGQRILRQGFKGSSFYVILDGEASLNLTRGRIVPLGPGDFFGELALLDGGPRTATILARGPVLTMAIGRRPFLKLVKSDADLALGLLKVMAERLRQADEARVPN